MTGTEGVIFCGKRGGPSFINGTRVDPSTMLCPKGYMPCLNDKKATEKVCLEPERIPADCPIIDLVLLTD